MACLVLLVFGLGYFVGKLSTHQDVASQANAPVIPVEGVTTQTSVSSPKNEKIISEPLSWSLPSSFLLKYWPTPMIDDITGRFEYATLLKYGLGVDGTKNLQNSINDEVDRLCQLEVKNSELVTDADGNQFFAILPFPADGRQLKADIKNLIINAFKGFVDDRGTLLAEALTCHAIFNGFGEFRSELAIEEIADGPNKKFVLRIKSSQPTRIQDDKNFPITGNYLANRFQLLLGKHKSSLKP